MATKQSQVKAKRKIINPIFHLQTKEEDDGKLSLSLLKHARKTGVLNLSSRNLQTVPERVWKIYEPVGDESSINYDLAKNNDEQPWWNFKPLNNLDLSSNYLPTIPSAIEMFQDLINLNLQDNEITSLPKELSALTKLNKLNLSRNKLSEIPDCVYKLTELRTLLLSYNNIDNVTLDIGDLIMLQHLDLSHNSITILPPGMGFLVRLTELNLAHNKLTEIPPDIVNLRVLTKLDLTHNELTTLPSLGELRKLQILYANHNNIEAIPDCEGCENIHELHFGNNYISEITPEFCEIMSHLKIFDLRDNKVEILPDEIAYMQQLIRLDLTNNSLTDLPNSMRLLPHLQSLQVEGNKIKTIRRDVIQGGTCRILKLLRERHQVEDIENIPPGANKKIVQPLHKFPDKYAMRNARALNLTMQELTSVPEEVFKEAEKAEISSVDLCKNKFTEIPSGLSLLAENITELNFSSNLICSVPVFLSNFLKLQYLNLSCNALSDLPISLGELKYLRELVLSNNRFNSIPSCVYEMESLEILLARDNKIDNIDVPNLARVKRLTVLDLANNNLNFIPPELGNLTQIRSLEINGNTFKQPRFAILAKGTDAIMAYLRDKIAS